MTGIIGTSILRSHWYSQITWTHWEIHCPNGTIFILKNDVGVCNGFPYLDTTKLKEHTKDSENTQEAVSASHVALMQTVRGDYEGFTDR